MQEKHLLRSVSPLPGAGGVMTCDGRRLLNFSSNDYLDFLSRPELKTASAGAVERYGAGSGASRLVTGTLDLHEELEHALARHKGYPAALVFGSGFLANLGAITAICGRGDLVFADRLVHASLIDAIRLSGAELTRFRHNDMAHLAECLAKTRAGKGRRLVVTESVFSMDGDLAPLTDLIPLAEEYGAMTLVDEAHASGVFGPHGGGLISQQGLNGRTNIAMSTFSKALGGYGGAVACSTVMRDWLINSARPFIYSTALPPSVCATALAALEILDREPDLGERLLAKASYFRDRLSAEGIETGSSASQIIPVMIGGNEEALAVSRALRERDIVVTAIRPPTVPAGTARLRFSVTLAHHNDDLARAATELGRCMKAVHETGRDAS